MNLGTNMRLHARRYIRSETWTLADDTELRDAADQYPLIARALRHWEGVPFFGILDYEPRKPDNPVSVSRREPVRHD